MAHQVECATRSMQSGSCSLVRKLLRTFRFSVESIRIWIDGLVHPEAARAPLCRLRHISFLKGCILSGAAALLAMPLHLALIGPMSVPLAAVFAFLLLHLPLALYVSHSGALERAVGVSSVALGVFVAGISALTGGLASIALPWLVVAPVQAALSGSSRIVAGTAGACVAALAAIAVFPVSEPVAAAASWYVLSGGAACVYAAFIVVQLSGETRSALFELGAAKARISVLSSASGEVTCDVHDDGSLTFVGGPIERLCGEHLHETGANWLFERLHVADRPGYLLQLSEVRNTRQPVVLEARLRTGSTAPGEVGHSEFIWAEIRMRFVDCWPAGEAAESQGRLILTLRDINRQKLREMALSEAKAKAESRGAGEDKGQQAGGSVLRSLPGTSAAAEVADAPVSSASENAAETPALSPVAPVAPGALAGVA